mmetsp:Transcript_6819/g.7886  ORF Transcript_6819/g.7886 Transcript_6819/m.7886 type:complete len:91 (-) Transcript_6819:33-305(-)
MRILYSTKECHSTPHDKKTDGEHHLVRELSLDEEFVGELAQHGGLLPTSMEQVRQIVSIKDEQIEQLKKEIEWAQEQLNTLMSTKNDHKQ